jgi:crotonobetainyl-CoA:carnitine CoA-transferase CaiB-like acyl-CoA transferase
MAVSPAAQVATMTPAPDWQHTLDYSTRFGAGRPQATRSPLVVDLSSLWAGPLCGQLLAACGARVVKIESLERPDGARRGDRSFFDLMNAEKESVALPFREGRGRDALAALLARADLVIEASRPRALEQLGIDATEFASRHGTTWVSITGHGRTPPGSEWVAFGDDAAASAGLVAASPANSSPCFCGDAIADPITGLHAAVAGLSAWAKGGARLVDISLQGVAAHVRHFPTPEAPAEAAGLVRPPRARPSQGRAPALGTDTRRVLTELGISC